MASSQLAVPRITLPRAKAASSRVQTLDMSAVPQPVFEAAVRVAGGALHWKASLRRILRTSGVSESAWLRNEHLSKYQILRSIWDELDRAGDRGVKVQRNIVAALANLDAPDPMADHEQGTKAIADLRRLATGAHLLVDPEEQERQSRRQSARAAAEERDLRAARLAALQVQFRSMHSETDVQKRGYELERLLADLFRLYELEMTGSYKTDSDQIDGAFDFDSFTYLLEARWRSVVAVEADLVVFEGKIRRRLDATRGLFVSMAGFRPEVIDAHRLAHDQRLVLADGQDLALMLEGRIELPDALRAKVRGASVRGEPFVPLASLL